MGTVVSCHENERYDIDYDDGDFEARVLRKHIKLLESQPEAADTVPSAPIAKRKAALTDLTSQQQQQQKRQRARSKADAPKVALEDDSPAPNYQAAEALVVVKVEANSEKEAAEADADAEAALAASSEVAKLKADAEAPAGGAAEEEALELGRAAAEEAPEPGRGAETEVGRADTSSARPRTTRPEQEPDRAEAAIKAQSDDEHDELLAAEVMASRAAARAAATGQLEAERQRVQAMLPFPWRARVSGSTDRVFFNPETRESTFKAPPPPPHRPPAPATSLHAPPLPFQAPPPGLLQPPPARPVSSLPVSSLPVSSLPVSSNPATGKRSTIMLDWSLSSRAAPGASPTPRDVQRAPVTAPASSSVAQELQARLPSYLSQIWAVCISTTTGQPYYAHRFDRQVSTFERPRAVGPLTAQGWLAMRVSTGPPEGAPLNDQHFQVQHRLKEAELAGRCEAGLPWADPPDERYPVPEDALLDPIGLASAEGSACKYFGSERGCLSALNARGQCEHGTHAAPNAARWCDRGQGCLKKGGCNLRHRQWRSWQDAECFYRRVGPYTLESSAETRALRALHAAEGRAGWAGQITRDDPYTEHKLAVGYAQHVLRGLFGQAPLPPRPPLPVPLALMWRMGYVEGRGLGKTGQGILEPVALRNERALGERQFYPLLGVGADLPTRAERELDSAHSGQQALEEQQQAVMHPPRPTLACSFVSGGVWAGLLSEEPVCLGERTWAQRDAAARLAAIDVEAD